MAMIGHGIVIQMATLAAPTVFTTMEETFEFDAPSFVYEDVEVTHYSSPNRIREYIAGLGDAGEASFTMNFVPDSPTDTYLRAAKGTNRWVKVSWPNGATHTFQATVREYGPEDTPVDDRLTAVVTLKVSGDITYGATSAPTNSVLPAISGIAQVGQTLTAFSGVWSGGAAFTYQWKAAAVDIIGATAKTYIPVAGDIGDVLTVAVTNTNSTGALTVTSTGTSAVIA